MVLIILSPAKSLNEEPSPPDAPAMTQAPPGFVKKTDQLVECIQQLPVSKLKQLLDVSDELSKLNHRRYTAFAEQPRKHCILAYDGPAYKALRAHDMSREQLETAQGCLRILSGLYGLLKPMDEIQPYRLDMGCKLATPECKDLYAFWSDLVTQQLAAELQQQADYGLNAWLVNVASQEYAKAVQFSQLGFKVVTCSFPGPAIYAKQARGLMARYIIVNSVQQPEQLHGFTGEDGEWRFNAQASSDTEFVFNRQAKPKAKAAPKARGKAKQAAADGGDDNEEDQQEEGEKAAAAVPKGRGKAQAEEGADAKVTVRQVRKKRKA